MTTVNADIAGRVETSGHMQADNMRGDNGLYYGRFFIILPIWIFVSRYLQAGVFELVV